MSRRYSEADLAAILARQHGHEFRYVPQWSYWMRWSGQRWEQDWDDAAITRATIALLSSHGVTESASRVSAVVRLARCWEGIATAPEAWDADPWLLNTPAGTFDLRTSENLGHRPGDLMTRITAAAPGGECPRFLSHFQWMLQGDADLGRFLARFLGYTLTGTNQEQCFLIGWGSGGNGKNVLFDSVCHVMGDYAGTAPDGLITSRDGECRPDALADLAGVRLALAPEAEIGHRLNEGQIKTITGSLKIKARKLYGHWFEFPSSFKLVLLTNPQPQVRGMHEGIWRRIRMVPFRAHCPTEQQDKGLAQWLIDNEGPGILKQLIAWSRHYHEQGLGTCRVVQEATREYRQEMDTLGAFLAEECEETATAEATNPELYTRYRVWSDRNGEHTMSQKAFSLALKERGFRQVRSSDGRVWQGIKVKGGY